MIDENLLSTGKRRFGFQAMIEEIEADMAAQLERVREMERAGELAPISRY